jgi:AcrR family transcriptional regulator
MTADGFASISIPNVAREAGVAIPTVYRHFKTKQDLLDALYPYAIRRAGLSTPPPPTNLAELRQGVIDYIDQLDTLDELTRASMASPASAEVRARSIPRRLEIFRPLVDSLEPPLSKADRDRIVRLIVALTQSSALRMLHDHLGQSPQQVANDIEWYVRAAIAAAEERGR